ncbi:MAG: lyase family protein, partial [Acidimicrobiales bacterium]
MADDAGFRTEHDSMGEVQVPADALWGAQTQRAVENFPISGRPIDRRLIRALALVKAEAARVNAGLDDVDAVDARIGEAIADGAEEVAAGDHDGQFPIDVFQTGSGTSSNMNANEVIARLAGEALGEQGAVHPNDHVNASQSSNDVFPTAIHVAATEGVQEDLVPALEHLASTLREKAGEFAEVVKSGRTHLM